MKVYFRAYLGNLGCALGTAPLATTVHAHNALMKDVGVAMDARRSTLGDLRAIATWALAACIPPPQQSPQHTDCAYQGPFIGDQAAITVCLNSHHM